MLKFTSPFPQDHQSPRLYALRPQMKPWHRCPALKTEHLVKVLFFFSKAIRWISSASSEPHPLFSAFVAASIIAVLYLPRNILLAFISPVILSTLFLLATLLRFGSRPSLLSETGSNHVIAPVDKAPDTVKDPLSSPKKPFFCEPAVQWEGWGGPLEIIYEEYEEEEEEEEDGECSSEYSKLGWWEGFCYSDVEAERVESPESFCFRWDEEEDDLIEIALEEDNMFEINLFACS